MSAPRPPSDLRQLNLPRPIEVEVTDDVPAVVIEGGTRLSVDRIDERWEVHVTWWRDPRRRAYFRVILVGGLVRTIFYDVGHDRWYAQPYG